MGMQRYMKGMSNGGLIQSSTPISNDELRAIVPSIFATEAHESRSERFAPIPTINVVEGLRREGFEPFFAQQSRTRVPGKADFTKHMLRMRHRGLVNDEGQTFEVILVNANDGTAAYQMVPGFFRFVCANGLFVGDKFEEVKVRHSGNAVDAVIEGAFRVLDEAPRVIEQTREWRGLKLLPAEREVFAEAAHMLRFPDAHVPAGDDLTIDPRTGEPAVKRPAPITAADLLRPRRYDDRNGDTLWHAFNVVQENAIKGGQSGYVRGSNGRARRQSTRAVQGIDQNKGLNRALWTLAERMAELKAA